MSYRQTLALAANRFPRQAQYPHGCRALLLARVRRLEAKLGREHRHA